MPYTAPLVKPTLPPLRFPTVSPYRPPSRAFPPTQTDPGYTPPNSPNQPTTDLQEIVCIYSNAPKWEPKKIRYRYQGENWQEIAGENFSIEQNSWESLPIFERYRVFYSANGWCFDGSGTKILGFSDVTGGFTIQKQIASDFAGFIKSGLGVIGNLTGSTFLLTDQIGAKSLIGNQENGLWVQYPPYSVEQAKAKTCDIYSWNVSPKRQFCEIITGDFIIFEPIYQPISSAPVVEKVVRVSDDQEIPPSECKFKIFGFFGETILNITRDTCPEVLIVPERCYFKPENERLVGKWTLNLGESFRTEYNANCATVFLDSPRYYFPIQAYKECSDNPICPPPRIRFDKKCEKKDECDQCPSGTTVKILNGLSLLCVNSSGCVKKILKYKPKCHSYDCICS